MSDNPYDAEVTELFALSERCRSWGEFNERVGRQNYPRDVCDEFKRLSLILDDIAKRICERWTETLP